ncbi:hypothetical protein AAMO2058_000732500 [Amorphochlora amoebiformis]
MRSAMIAEYAAKGLAFAVMTFFFGGGMNLVLYFRVDRHTGLGMEEALFLTLCFAIYAIFTVLSYLLSGRTYTDRPDSIFEMAEIKFSKRSSFQGPRFHDPSAAKSTSRNSALTSTSTSDAKQRRKNKKNTKNSAGRADRDSNDFADAPRSEEWSMGMFNLGYIMEAGFGGGELHREGGKGPSPATWRRPIKYHIFNIVAVFLPFLFMFIPLVPCWLRDSHGLRCSASGTPTAIFIVVWNCLVAFLLGAQYAGMALTAGTLLGHSEGMARVMGSLVSHIETIDHLEAWHTTMWHLHRHIRSKIRPFKALIITSAGLAVALTLGAVVLGIAHFAVNDRQEINELEAAWIQLLISAAAFAAPSIALLAFAAQINAILCRAVDKLDETGGGQEISLAEYYSTVIEYWKRRKKGIVFFGIHLTDLACFYFTIALAMIALVPIIFAGSF